MSEVIVDESKIGQKVDGKVAIVTGGASGIGKAIVEVLHKHGALIVFCDLNVSAGEELARNLGSHVSFRRANVLVWKELLAVFKYAKERHGSIDIVFANAGINEPSNTFADTLDEHGELAEPNLITIDINLSSVISTTKLALFYFKSNRLPGGSLVLTCSTSGYNERPNLPVYSAAKHGVAGLMRALRKGTPAAGVSISMISPGVVATPLVPQFAQDAAVAMGVPVQPAEYCGLAAVFLASDKAWNGKSLTLIASRAFEVEGTLTETQPLWYGKYPTEMATKAAAVNLSKPL